jgi:RimJ/RimL family protein N-acetyltransferase
MNVSLARFALWNLKTCALANVVVGQHHNYVEISQALLDYVKEIFSDRPLVAAAWATPDDQNWHNALLRRGFEIYIEKCYFRKDLKGYISPYANHFAFQSMNEFGENEFLNHFVRIFPGNANRDFNNANPKSDFYELKGSSVENFDPARWKIAYFHGEAVGIMILKMFEHDIREGGLLSYGLFPEYRGKGLGKALHAVGLEHLAQLGAEHYVGSTDCLNDAMIKIFEANGCSDAGIRRQYRFLKPGSAADIWI